MNVILQDTLPEAQMGTPALPGVGPCAPDDWLRLDEAYGAQMVYKTELLAHRREAVLWCDPAAMGAAREVLSEALQLLPALGFIVVDKQVICPDGRAIDLDWAEPLLTLGHLLQEDICILQKRGDAHVLTGAVLCFPANWRLADKAGRPLIGIHDTVAEYDANIARRVQRLFDGVRVGRPLWRFNRLAYAEPDLHQPRRIADDRQRQFVRSERQCILRLPKSDAVIFTIHTWVVRG
tara:strand:+ start:30 stop:737 length:708 start_codon:yes stop_codon:yes gene_type:complete